MLNADSGFPARSLLQLGVGQPAKHPAAKSETTICVARFKSSPWPLRHSPAKKSDTALALYLRVSEALGVGQPASAA